MESLYPCTNGRMQNGGPGGSFPPFFPPTKPWKGALPLSLPLCPYLPPSLGFVWFEGWKGGMKMRFGRMGNVKHGEDYINP
ncbi:hypothetical protein TIFTF001_035659 [Ficus carica]|uniref:Uncharacterized protein n=1 Tax=Ficus carica TaxID=3494 RepID=A0AA88E2C4_FICCA|nr:hypothetical protein TIFTF001_035659 [Ficus carica]